MVAFAAACDFHALGRILDSIDSSSSIQSHSICRLYFINSVDSNQSHRPQFFARIRSHCSIFFRFDSVAVNRFQLVDFVSSIRSIQIDQFELIFIHWFGRLGQFFLFYFCSIGCGRIAQFFRFDSVAVNLFQLVDFISSIQSIQIDHFDLIFIDWFGRLGQFFLFYFCRFRRGRIVHIGREFM